jgi:[protein-PII] uridylyltransferase
VTDSPPLAPDHPWLPIIAGACAMAGANIVDAQITRSTAARSTPSLSRIDRDEDASGVPAALPFNGGRCAAN